ncbi:MAG: prepilin peptidase [Treponema sp.]|jgi:prepilin signal peptidase PulO-like enzyme (type II secretory pathway)|nr:prepilin peptidase [Treponema sp.]
MVKIAAPFLFCLFSVIVAVVDIKTGSIPRFAFLCAFALFFALKLFSEGRELLFLSLAGCGTGIGLFLLAFFVSGKKLGLADVWYSGLIGLVLGPLWWYPATFAACAAGLIWLLGAKRDSIPFIPCMAAGGVVALLVKDAWL